MMIIIRKKKKEMRVQEQQIVHFHPFSHKSLSHNRFQSLGNKNYCSRIMSRTGLENISIVQWSLSQVYMSLLSFYQPAVHAFESQSYYIVNVSLNQPALAGEFF